MTMKHADLCSNFVSGDREGKAASMFIDGDTIYSYGYHFPLAKRINHGEFLFNPDHYSISTSKHQCRMRSALQYATYWPVTDCDVEKMQEFIQDKIQESADKIPRARQNFPWYISALKGGLEEYKKASERFGFDSDPGVDVESILDDEKVQVRLVELTMKGVL